MTTILLCIEWCLMVIGWFQWEFQYVFKIILWFHEVVWLRQCCFKRWPLLRPLEEKNSLMTNTVQDLPVTLEEVYQRLYQSMIIRNVTFSFQHIFGCWFGNGILLCFGLASVFNRQFREHPAMNPPHPQIITNFCPVWKGYTLYILYYRICIVPPLPSRNNSKRRLNPLRPAFLYKIRDQFPPLQLTHCQLH